MIDKDRDTWSMVERDRDTRGMVERDRDTRSDGWTEGMGGGGGMGGLSSRGVQTCLSAGTHSQKSSVKRDLL
jgi:hypothetical protein